MTWENKGSVQEIDVKTRGNGADELVERVVSADVLAHVDDAPPRHHPGGVMAMVTPLGLLTLRRFAAS